MTKKGCQILYENEDDMSMYSSWIFILSLLFSVVHYIWLMYLEYRQRMVLINDSIPQGSSQTIKDYFDSLSKYQVQTMRQYGLEKLNIRCLDLSINQVATLAIMFTLGKLWNASLEVSVSEFHRSLFVGIIIAIGLNLTSIPISIAKYQIETKYEFMKKSKSSIVSIVSSGILKQILTAVVALITTSIILKLFESVAYLSLLVIWIFVVIVQFFIIPPMLAYLLPIVDSFEKLPEGPLKIEVEALVERVGFPKDKVFVKTCPSSNFHSNAYCFGLCCYKQIVLYDTALETFERKKLKKYQGTKSVSCSMKLANFRGLNTEEMLGVLSHELGHWKKKHVLKLFGLFKQIQIIILLSLLGYLSSFEQIYVSFGLHSSEKPILIGLILIYYYILSPVRILFEVLMNKLSRFYELEADQYSYFLGHGDGLCLGLMQIYTDNLKYPFDDKLYCMWYFNHPTLSERIKYIKLHPNELETN